MSLSRFRFPMAPIRRTKKANTERVFHRCAVDHIVSPSSTTEHVPFSVMLYSPVNDTTPPPPATPPPEPPDDDGGGGTASEKSCTSSATPPCLSSISYFFVLLFVDMMIVSSSGRYVNLMRERCDERESTSTVLRYAKRHRDNTRRTMSGRGGRRGWDALSRTSAERKSSSGVGVVVVVSFLFARERACGQCGRVEWAMRRGGEEVRREKGADDATSSDAAGDGSQPRNYENAEQSQHGCQPNPLPPPPSLTSLRLSFLQVTFVFPRETPVLPR